jgi:hypothetical protein
MPHASFDSGPTTQPHIRHPPESAIGHSGNPPSGSGISDRVGSESVIECPESVIGFRGNQQSRSAGISNRVPRESAIAFHQNMQQLPPTPSLSGLGRPGRQQISSVRLDADGYALLRLHPTLAHRFH